MGERLRRPLDPAAVRAADDAFYAEHPEMVVKGRRRPIRRSDPRFDAQAARWRELYAASGGPMEGAQEQWASPTRAVEAAEETCPLAWIEIQLCYHEDGAAFASERYEVVLADSAKREGTLSGGSVYLGGIPAGACSIRFVEWKSPPA